MRIRSILGWSAHRRAQFQQAKASHSKWSLLHTILLLKRNDNSKKNHNWNIMCAKVLWSTKQTANWLLRTLQRPQLYWNCQLFWHRDQTRQIHSICIYLGDEDSGDATVWDRIFAALSSMTSDDSTTFHAVLAELLELILTRRFTAVDHSKSCPSKGLSAEFNTWGSWASAFNACMAVSYCSPTIAS